MNRLLLPVALLLVSRGAEGAPQTTAPRIVPASVEAGAPSTSSLSATAIDLRSIAARAFRPASRGAILLNLPDSVSRALRQNKTLSVHRLDPEIARAQVLQQKGAFDQTLTSLLERQHNQVPAASSLTGATVAESDNQFANVGYHTRLQEGSTVDFNVNNVRNETNSRFQVLNPAYSSNIGVSLVKPLLRNGGYGPVTANLRVARNAVQQGLLRLRKQVIDTVAAVTTQYWNLVFAREDREVKRFSVEAARQLLQFNQTRRTSGLGSDVQVIEAETTLQTRTDDLEIADRVVSDAQEVFRHQLSLEDAPPGAELVPVQPPALLPRTVPLDQAMITAFQRRPDRLDALTEMRNKDIRLTFLDNQRLPKVDLVATYLQNGLGNAFGPALDQAAGNDFPGYTVGLQVEFPLTNRLARGNFKQGQLEKRQAVINLRAVEDQIQEDVTRSVGGLDTNLRRVTVSQRGAELAARQLAAAEERYRQGLITNFDLLRFQQDLADARSRALRAVVDAQNSGISVEAATALLLDANGIVVEEAETRDAPAPVK